MEFSWKRTAMFAIAGIFSGTIAVYYFSQNTAQNDFSCAAGLVQHYSYDQLNVSLNYTIRGTSGIISISGHSHADPNKTFNRKISFSIHKDDDIYYLLSKQNLRFPDDNVDDAWLSQHEPVFFVYPNKSIYMRIEKQKNKSYLFMTNSIPTYICKQIPG